MPCPLRARSSPRAPSGRLVFLELFPGQLPEGIGDLPLPFVGGVLVDQGSTGAAVSHAGHQLSQARTGTGREVVSGMPQIVEVDAGQASGLQRREPDPAPEVPRRSGAPPGPVKIRSVWPGEVKHVRCQLRTGETRSGKLTVRMPASDLGGPKARPPPCSSVRVRSTLTVLASKSTSAWRNAHSSPHRRLVSAPMRTRAWYLGPITSASAKTWGTVSPTPARRRPG